MEIETNVSDSKPMAFVAAVTSHLSSRQQTSRSFKQRQRDKGFIQVGFWVPEELASQFQLAAARCREEPHYELLLRDTRTGRMVAL